MNYIQICVFILPFVNINTFHNFNMYSFRQNILLYLIISIFNINSILYKRNYLTNNLDKYTNIFCDNNMYKAGRNTSGLQDIYLNYDLVTSYRNNDTYGIKYQSQKLLFKILHGFYQVNVLHYQKNIFKMQFQQYEMKYLQELRVLHPMYSNCNWITIEQLDRAGTQIICSSIIIITYIIYSTLLYFYT